MKAAAPATAQRGAFSSLNVSLGGCHRTLVQKTQQKKKNKAKQNKGKSTNRQGLGSDRRKKKRSYELYLLCPRSFTALASVCGYLFTQGQIAGSARSLQLPASRRSRRGKRAPRAPRPSR